jgi:hypothetical protein
MEIGFEGVEWIHLGQDTLRWPASVNTVMNPRVLLKARYSTS